MEWSQAREALASPLFAALQPSLAALPRHRWPSLDELNALAADASTTAGHPVRFIPVPDSLATHYELHIAATGEVPTRDNWHDLLNALAWIAWPRTKARINAQHAAILAERGAEELRHRGPERDALTLFDEAGVVVAASDPQVLRRITDHEWKRLFWEEREHTAANMSCFVFGHGTLEQALAPYVGMVCKAVFVPVESIFHAMPVEVQLPRLDASMASHFGSRVRFASPKSMGALPILGIPGWHPDQDEAFYENTDYFRAKRRIAP